MPNLSRIFSALSDQTRFAFVERLLTEGEMSVAALREGVEISAPAVSRHLNVLNDAGLVVRRSYRQQRLYSVRPEAMQAITTWTMSHKDFWQASLARLEAALLQKDTK